MTDKCYECGEPLCLMCPLCNDGDIEEQRTAIWNDALEGACELLWNREQQAVSISDYTTANKMRILIGEIRGLRKA